MGTCIKFGDYNKNYKYIIFTCIFNYLTYFVTLGDLKEILISSKIIDEENKSLPTHAGINDIFNYIGIIIISIILDKYKEKKSSNNKQNNEIINNKKISTEILLIHNDIKEEINKNISILNLFFVLSYWIFIDHTTRIIQPLMIFDYWMFELLFISFMTSILLKTKIYIHQKIGIIINSLNGLILGIIIFINKENEENNLNMKYKWLIPISIIIYLFIINSTSYIYTKLKFYMDLKFISQEKLLIFYGTIGFVFSIIACVIESSFKCVGSEKKFFCKVNKEIYIIENYTNITQNDTNNEIYIYNENYSEYDLYIENFFIFIEDFSKLNSKEITIEIVIIFIGMIFYYCSLYFDILIINYLTPMHFMFSSLIYLFLDEIINFIKEKIITGNFFKNGYLNLFNISAYIFSFIGFMIYLEIIELNFCKLNYNLRKYINERSIKDFKADLFNDSIITESENSSRTSSINDYDYEYVELPNNKRK